MAARIILLLALLVGACAQPESYERTNRRRSPTDEAEEKGGKGTRGEDGEGQDAEEADEPLSFPKLPELDAELTSLLGSNSAVPGATVAIIKNGKVAFASGYGSARVQPAMPMAYDTIINVASISKVATALAVVRLAADGKLKLDDDVSTVLGFSLRNPNHPSVAITLRMLLAHTSSINSRGDSMSAPIEGNWVEGGDATISLKTLVEDTFKEGARWYSAEHYYPDAPGETFDYCNICPAISAHIVEKVSGKSFEQFSKEQIFKPIGMKSTSWRLADTKQDRLASGYSENKAIAHQGAPYYPATGLRTTAVDLARFVAEFTSAHSVVNAKWATEMFRVQYPNVQSDGESFGLGWYSTKPQIFGHNGSDVGHSANVFVRPSDGTGILYLLNGEADQSLQDSFASALWSAADAL